MIFSMVIPGLGQLYQGRRPAALIHFVGAVMLWTLGYGWIVHLYSGIEAAYRSQGGTH